MGNISSECSFPQKVSFRLETLESRQRMLAAVAGEDGAIA